MNVILITIDSLRADHMGSMGYVKKLTPYLDKIADEGVLFTNAFSYGSTTFTSVPPLLTSSPFISYYHFHEFHKTINKSMNIHDSLERYKKLIIKHFESNVTIAGALREHGYETAAFNSNPYLSRYYGYGKDFSHFDDSFVEYNFGKRMREKVKVALMSTKLENLAKRLYFLVCRNNIPYERAETINKKAISWLAAKKPENFFMWLHYMDTHAPYKPPKQFRPEISSLKMSDLGRKILCKEDISNGELNQLIELYDGGIKYVDHSIKCLLDDLKDLMLLEDTIIIITADHGEEFKEHGDFLHVETKLYEELIHIPLIIYNSGHCATINETVSHIDIAPTILEMLNLPKVKTFKGNSLISILNGEARSGVISEGIGSQSIGDDLKLIISYRTKKWKYILNKMKDENELYNLEENPNEMENLKDVKKDIAESLNSIILEYILHQKKLVATDVKKEKMIGKIKKLKKGKKIS